MIPDCRWCQIVLGIIQSYQSNELISKEIIVIDNLAPRMIKEIESQRMLLVIEDEISIVVLLTPGKEVESGTKVN